MRYAAAHVSREYQKIGEGSGFREGLGYPSAPNPPHNPKAPRKNRQKGHRDRKTEDHGAERAGFVQTLTSGSLIGRE